MCIPRLVRTSTELGFKSGRNWYEFTTNHLIDLAPSREIEHLKYCELSTAAQKSENDDDFGDFIEDKKHKIFATCTCGAAEAATNSDDLQTITEKAYVLFSIILYIL